MKKILIYLKKIWSLPIVTNLISVGLITLLVKGFAFFKESLVASTFGLSELLDTFYIAILIPNFVEHVFISALKNLFIPNYLAEKGSTKNLGEFQTVIFIIITILVVTLTAICLIFSEFFLESVFIDHHEDFYTLVRKQLYILLPCLIFWGYSSILGGLLEIEDRFKVTSLTPLITTLTTIIVLVFFKDLMGEMVLAYGILIGTILSFAYLAFYAFRENVIFISKPRLNHNIQMMLNQLAPKVTSGLLTGINPYVDQFFAAQLVVGSITAINYGRKIPAFVIGILIIALGNVLLPHFSKLITNNLEKAYSQLFKILLTIFFGAAIVSIMTIYFSEEIISLLFERNEFTAKDTVVVAEIQQIVLIYVPFYLCTLILVKFLTSINKNSFMAWVSLWNLGLNLVLDYILVEKYKVYGLVMSTSIVYIICSVIYLSFTYREYKKFKVNMG